MNTFDFLLQGLAIAAQPINLFYALIGVTLGTLVGVLPGIGPALTVALLLPVTFKLDPAGSLIMFAGIYYGGMYGGSTTAILLNAPGESASLATALEGSKMAKAGRGGPALATSAIGSFVAGLIATIGLAFLAPWLVEVAVKFGPWDYFALMIVAFVTVSATFGDSPLRGLSVIGYACLAMAALLALAERICRHNRDISQMRLRDALIVGIAQVGALIPGVSRSGSTLTAAMFLNLRRE